MMENLIKIFYGWEIQMLVLLSFAIQMFLFFSSGLRRRNTNILLRLSIWIAYLGADWVAVYALGYLSRHMDANNGTDTLRLASFWAPFLLIHLGGQDTITAFAIEDNNLWLRHLLNLVVQAGLALYVFWKSIGTHNIELLVSGIFVFVAGVIKYGERIWSLKCGSFKSLQDSTGNPYKHRWLEGIDSGVGYPNIICTSLASMSKVFGIFGARTGTFRSSPTSGLRDVDAWQPNKAGKVLGIQLVMMYDDIYTKALVLKTRSGIILRCISQLSMVVAFTLFLAGDRRSYSSADTAITYALFAGGLFLELGAMFIFVMSPWTWAWFKSRKYNRLAWFSWFLFTSDLIGWSEKRPLWSNAMGQYNFIRWIAGSDQRPMSCTQRLMTMAIKLAKFFGAGQGKLFWMSKLLDTEHTIADEVLECLLEGVSRFRNEGGSDSQGHQRFPNLYPSLAYAQNLYTFDFGYTVAFMHMITEHHLSKQEYRHSDTGENVAADAATASSTDALVEVCRKLSRYMMYLLVAQPSLLPLNASAADTLQDLQGNDSWDQRRRELGRFEPQPGRETLEELKEAWTRIVVYAAAKSRPEVHAALLARGGELLTFVWLLLAHRGMGDLGVFKIELGNPRSNDPIHYALDLPKGP